MYTSKSNPIIQSVRSQLEDLGGIYRDRGDFWYDAALYLCSGTHADGVPINRAHKEHARAIFLRLSELNRMSND